ncbi:MAG: type I-E CRISPR-associated protein Cas5/CasD [Clostridia bacterium]|nr:type I-E CRISPR-associated protein Cas5/CasD [Clostridia bacterium]
MKLIKLILSGPLQSWGEDARWNQRTTAAMPTKSAIIGMIGSCLGIPRGDEQLNKLDHDLYVAIRADQPGRVMTDYHTVNSLNREPLPTANGGNRGRGKGIETPKQYLQDARFTVFLWGYEDTLAACFQAMEHPKWAVYLGRKSCVPSVPVIPEWIEAASPEEAVAVFSEEEKQRRNLWVQVEMDTQPNDPLGSGQRIITRRDAILRADRNEYGIRWVKAFAVKSGGEASCT